jgi:transcriptional regulator with XRE-family HTH domain
VPNPHSAAAKLLGGRLRDARLKLSLTLEDVGALSEVHWTSVGKIERGQVHPSIETLVRITTALNADPADFVAGLTSDMYPRRTHRMTAADYIRAKKRDEEGEKGEK